jgi:hypothetical protein
MKKHPHVLLLIVLAGLAFNAHALCVNPDGSLDDASVPVASVSVEVLPACEISSAKAADATAPELSSAERRNLTPILPAIKAKASDRGEFINGDCHSNDGESRDGYIGAADMLPECSL